jgi:hypothetical protein
MKKTILVFAVSLLSSIGAIAAEPGVRGVARIPLDLQSGIPTAEVFVNGKGPYRFLLDTSVKASLIFDRSLAKELALRRRSNRVVNVGCVSLGDARFDALNAIVDDVRDKFHADGIIGFGLFADVLAVLDLRNAELRVSNGALPKEGAPVQSLKLFDGVPGVMLKAGDRFLFASINTEVASALTVPTSMASSVSSESELRLGTAAMTRAEVTAVDTTSLPTLGNAFLSNAVVTFDTAHRRVAIEQAR